MKPLSEQNHYEILEIESDAAAAEIERAFRMAQSTYADEIRSEKQGRGGAIFDCEEASFTARSQLALQGLPEIGGIDADGTTVHSFIAESRKRVYRLGLLLKRPLTKGVTAPASPSLAVALTTPSPPSCLT